MEAGASFNLLQMVVDIFSDMLSQIKSKNASIKVKVAHEKNFGLLSNVHFDKDCLHSILYNFIANSIDMVEPNEEVSLYIDLEKMKNQS